MFIKSNLKIVARFTTTVVCLVALSGAVRASLIAYEPFNYTTSIPNGTASTASGFSGNWACGVTPAIAAGMTYTSLPTANGSLSSTSGRQAVAFASPLSSGTKWISFLFNQTGNNGGNHCGVYFPNGGTGLFFGYGLNPIDAATGALRPGSILTTGTTVAPATSLASSFTGTYGATPYLVVLKIDFNTSGANDTVTIYINPTANAAAPGVTATYTLTTFDVGTITGIGFQNPGGGFAIKADEIRVGDSYADVAGVGGVVTVAAPVITGVTPGTGYTNGGTVVTITGSNFLSGATVQFGANAGTGILVAGSNSITATTPAGVPGAVNVVVLNTNALSATSSNGFTYVLPPPPPVTIFASSVVKSDAALNIIWKGGTNTTSVLLTTTNMGSGAIWTPVVTNVFGGDGWSTNSMPINPGEPKRFYGLSIPADIIVVLAPTSLHTMASGFTNAIGLAWTASSTPGVIGYRILYGTSSGAMTNSTDVGNVTSAIISGLTPGQTYYVSVITLAANGQSLAADSSITAQPDTTIGIIPLFDTSTQLEPATTVNTPTALITYLADRARDRHARESDFHLYDHYLSWYWEQRVASIEIIDTVAKGGSTITFNYTTLAELNPAEFRTFFRGITTVAEYQNNQQATLVSTNASAFPGETDFHYTATISANAQFNRPLQLGDRVEVEISQFLLAPRHGRANYYGTVILYVVGQGIVPWASSATQVDAANMANNGPVVGNVRTNLDSYPMPTNGWLGGLTTLPYQYSDEPSNHFKEFAGNISPTNGFPFMLGRRLHHTDFGDGTHSEPDNPVFTEQIGKLGPRFINRSCVACHVNNGRALPPAIGAPMLQSAVKVGSDANGARHPTLGSVLQPQITTGSPEGGMTIASYTTTSGQYGDGTPYTLQKPNYTFSGTTPAFFSVRLAPQLVGMGLLEAVSESTIQALADPNDADHDGISGRIQTVVDPETGQPRLGRFGYKGGKARVSHQIAGAYNTDMGVTSPIFPVLDDGTSNAIPEVSLDDIDKLNRYVTLLGVSARRSLNDPQALQGEQLFASANCVKCHTATLTTSPYHPMTELRNQVIHPYTDLLLHDLGPGLADNMGEASASGSEWRTAPLWSIGLTAGISGGEAYLHDGRARSLEEAILWHDGEAAASKEIFRTMSATERAALIKFLKSL
ncbi:MAG TPA: di-heme oxidoredictase family protein [Verrucomicrobiae bacterium]|nr:di-heme oxidoredictase family protein [Verrucomicrobiae bacterium]